MNSQTVWIQEGEGGGIPSFLLDGKSPPQISERRGKIKSFENKIKLLTDTRLDRIITDKN